jgi:tetratricopeptide (TPR) repeat protein
MGIYVRIVSIFMIGICSSPLTAVLAQETLWKDLNIEVVKLVQEGKYTDAVKVAKRSLEIAEETFGSDHVKVALSLNNLATLYRIQGKYTEAESLYKRALAIWEKAFGPEDRGTISEQSGFTLQNSG